MSTPAKLAQLRPRWNTPIAPRQKDLNFEHPPGAPHAEDEVWQRHRPAGTNRIISFTDTKDMLLSAANEIGNVVQRKRIQGVDCRATAGAVARTAHQDGREEAKEMKSHILE